MYVSYSHVAEEPACLSWEGPGHSLSLEAELPPVTADMTIW